MTPDVPVNRTGLTSERARLLYQPWGLQCGESLTCQAPSRWGPRVRLPLPEEPYYVHYLRGTAHCVYSIVTNHSEEGRARKL